MKIITNNLRVPAKNQSLNHDDQTVGASGLFKISQLAKDVGDLNTVLNMLAQGGSEIDRINSSNTKLLEAKSLPLTGMDKIDLSL